jgi:putative transposase
MWYQHLLHRTTRWGLLSDTFGKEELSKKVNLRVKLDFRISAINRVWPRELINMSLRKVIKTSTSFPTDEAVSKLLYLALNNISKKWAMPIRGWKAALNRFTMQFEDRLLSA